MVLSLHHAKLNYSFCKVYLHLFQKMVFDFSNILRKKDLTRPVRCSWRLIRKIYTQRKKSIIYFTKNVCFTKKYMFYQKNICFTKNIYFIKRFMFYKNFMFHKKYMIYKKNIFFRLPILFFLLVFEKDIMH